MSYSIIIPVHNEEDSIPTLLKELKKFSTENQIIIINDGSNDSTEYFLKESSFINLINFKFNKGKGEAIKAGLNFAKNEKVIIFDGDLEIDTNQITEFMVLDKDSNINFVLGYRFIKIDQFQSVWNLGNFVLNKLFNYFNKSNISDALCCAKSFYKSDIKLDYIKSKRFDIDVEISMELLKKTRHYKSIHVKYKRRNIDQGKKLKLVDGWSILRRIIF